MSFLGIVWSGISYFLSLLGYWLSLFFVFPFKNVEVLWIIIPIWINLLISDFYQEKHGTNIGNAITNGAMMLWVGIDWIRFLFRNYTGWNHLLTFKIFLCLLTFIFGVIIMYEGIKDRTIVRMIGRVRETSYIMLVFTPVLYNIVEPSTKYIISVIVFFPLFYFLFELVDRAIPDPRGIYDDTNKSNTLSELKI